MKVEEKRSNKAAEENHTSILEFIIILIKEHAKIEDDMNSSNVKNDLKNCIIITLSYQTKKFLS